MTHSLSPLFWKIKFSKGHFYLQKCKCITSQNNCSYSVRGLQSTIESCALSTYDHFWVHLWKVELFLAEVNICRCRSLWMCWGLGTCLCRTLYRTERIRMKYWVHLWISGAERPLVGASACIFSWWKPLDGSFLLAASLNSESQKCNAPDGKKTKIYRDGTLARFSFAMVQTLDNDSECVCVCVAYLNKQGVDFSIIPLNYFLRWFWVL